ncbi:AmmeMemoRadiSam system radical SAM enzyme [Candidatus Micrarchaeota archaeon CG10_big_fil_rev_8_21_14_0_10_45_29]|nr:MAG: AmmeMemoRadiSam system radical SAM enzyme [Candidatus Micrarchaeota archaeon CG10_big_fil_rev_8_21_14_0_10_45_29]
MQNEKFPALSYTGYAHPAMLFKKFSQNRAVKCELCSHYCIIRENDSGFCLTRINKGGKLFTINYGKAAGIAIDPIEKKPFFHFKPGSRLLSFGTPGCNFRCLNCQNYSLSQAVNMEGAKALEMPPTMPEQIVHEAAKNRVNGFAYTYNEPTIFLEYARDIALACRQNEKAKNMFHTFVSNGYFTKEAFELIQKENLLQAIRIDLKFMDDEKYFKICHARLKPVLDSIKRVHESKIHLEIINLLIPKQNDDEGSIMRTCEFVKSLSPQIPLHFSRFFPYYKMQDLPATSLQSLKNAKKIAEDAGLNYVYIGNTGIPGAEDTYCPKCNFSLIKRSRFGIIKNEFEKTKKPVCPKCGEKINIIL